MTKRFCYTCHKEVDDMAVMGAYWVDNSPCKREGCDAKYNIEKEQAAWRAKRIAAREYDGPGRATCAVCGHEIPSYESRYFGPIGAVHIHPLPGQEPCKFDKALYPFYYTDG